MKNMNEILKQILAENNFSPESIFYRFTAPSHLEYSENGIISILAKENAEELIIDLYQGQGHSFMARNIGFGLAFTTLVEEDYIIEGKIGVKVKLKDILNQGGLIYPVISVPEYITSFFFSLPNGKVHVELLNEN